MHSRYSAYAHQELEHLMRTTPRELRTTTERSRLAQSLPIALWLSLKILEELGSRGDSCGPASSR